MIILNDDDYRKRKHVSRIKSRNSEKSLTRVISFCFLATVCLSVWYNNNGDTMVLFEI